MTPHSTTDAQAERSAETRSRILDAALSEFAANGLAGARTEQIAVAAGVNKALLYYYFESKEKLYSAALEMVSARVRDRSMAVFLRDATPGERMIRAALDHFDRILTQREFQTLMQHEMMRMHKGEEGEWLILVKRIFAPLHAIFQSNSISTCEMIEGNLPGKQIKLIIAWAELHKDELLADWELANNGEKPYSIEPLR